MIENNTFKFVIHNESFLTKSQCEDLINYFEQNQSQDSELAGQYDKNIMNKEVRNTEEMIYTDEKMLSKIKMVLELSNISTYHYNIQEMSSVKLLKYGVGGRYKWHTDCGAKETSTRKLTAIIQLSDENDYQGGDLEFGITDKTGQNNYTATRKQGSIIIFPAFLSHRVTPITEGKRYSMLSWMLGDTFV